MDSIFDNFNPNLILVHGDTTTSAMVALAAFHRGIKIGHVEAGLRTHNKFSPFPEEVNRQITGKLADYHFAPTHWAANNLINEKIQEKDIVITGNTVIDALYFGINKLKSGYSSTTIKELKKINVTDKKIILVTGHRRENFGTGFENLCYALKQIAEKNDVIIIYPVHLNPNVQEPVNRILSDLDNVFLINPLDYPSFLFLMKQSYLILTDSGGVQEEAPSLGKPVLVMRDSTERPEALESGTVKLVGTNTNVIIEETEKLLYNDNYYQSFSSKSNPYGDGTASKKIVEFINSI
jgi:UDP-N-acetylglucosamine 2-epimerase (non-hydrolysing)